MIPIEDQYCVYILCNKPHGTLYSGVTNNLVRRIYEHKEGLAEGYTKRYGVHRLVYYEIFHDIRTAIQREKRLKKYKRNWKFSLIHRDNPNWLDLYSEITK